MFYQKSRWLVVPLSAAMLFFAACSDDDSSDKEVDPGQNQEEDFKLASQIEVDGGLVSGMAQGTVTSFKGIPYAAPPAGDLRWKAPQSVVAWDGVKECDEFGPSAIQTDQSSDDTWTTEFIIDTSLGYSEGECLTLNVWTDNVSSDGERPVIFYIHGGGYTAGGSSCEVYSGQEIAKKGAVYVSINYRVAANGFLAHPLLSAESEENVSGNYGILDMVAALKWVKNNISRFGGDPENVTIVGQSAGAGSVSCLIISPKAAGLFHRAVVLSYNYINSAMPTLESLETQSEAAADLAGKTLEEMRAMTTDELKALLSNPFMSQVSCQPCVDGVVIPKNTLETYKEGTQNDVPIMTGMAAEDIIFFGAFPSWFQPDPTAMTIAEYTEKITNVYGDLADECLSAYPASDDDEALASYVALSRENFLADQYFLAKARALKGNSSTYLYYYTHVMPGENSDTIGAFHTSDVPYFLNYFSGERSDYWTQADYDMGEAMSSYLVNFAKNGDPNGSGLTEWGAFDGGMDFFELGDTISPLSFSEAKAAFWNTYGSEKLGL